MDHTDRDIQIRLSAFKFLDEQKSIFGGELPRTILEQGFQFDGQRVPLIGPQGIFKPRILTRPVPLSITTAPVRPGRERPYEDNERSDGLLSYKYRGTDPNHHENVGLRLAMKEEVPLVYFLGIDTGWYSAAYPVYIVADDPGSLSVVVAADDRVSLGARIGQVAEGLVEARREYATQEVKRRMHQDKFRHNVLVAYESSCAICALRHRQLLEAAHIIPDHDVRGVPEVSNGLSLCKLHHAAFDSHIVGISPGLVVEVREDVRKEKDGPMLVHGIQECHGKLLRVVPRKDSWKPREELLKERYDRFLAAG